MPTRDLWTLGENLANNSSIWKKMRHSKFADPFRRKSISRVGRKAIAVTTSLIPIPIVKNAVNKAVDIAAGWIREQQINYKTKRKYGTVSLVDKKTKTVKKVKWGWKEMNIEDMDRYRWKVKHGVEIYAKTKKYAVENFDSTASICNDVGRAISKLVYLKKRINKLEKKALAIRSLSHLTLLWLDDIRGGKSHVKMDALKPTAVPFTYFVNEEDSLRTMATHARVTSTGDQHTKCDKTMCVHQDQVRFWQRHQKGTKVLSTISSTIIDTFDTTDVETYDEETYTG